MKSSKFNEVQNLQCSHLLRFLYASLYLAIYLLHASVLPWVNLLKTQTGFLKLFLEVCCFEVSPISSPYLGFKDAHILCMGQLGAVGGEICPSTSLSVEGPISLTNLRDSESRLSRFIKAITSFRCKCRV